MMLTGDNEIHIALIRPDGGSTQYALMRAGQVLSSYPSATEAIAAKVRLERLQGGSLR
jgi:hypothetical protein